MRLAVASFACLVIVSSAELALAQQPPSIGATPRIVFARPGTNPFLDASRTHTQTAPPAVHAGDAAWQVITPAPKGPRTNDCQMPVVVGRTTIDPLFGKPVIASPSPMAKVAVPCHARKR